MLKNQDRLEIINSLIKIIYNISDKDYQKKAWLNGEGADFDENVCLFFDLGDPVLKNYKDFGITYSQYKILKKFRNEFNVFSDEHDFPEAFIDSLEWGKIMNLGKDVLKAFDYQKK